MLFGSYHERENYPQIRAEVCFDPSSAIVTFMFDTGSNFTMLNAWNAEEAGIRSSDMTRSIAMAGIGGSEETELFRADLVFVGSDGTRFGYRTEVGILSEDASTHIPSILGRDILNYWNVRLFPFEGRFEADVLHCDFSLENNSDDNS
jgi:hypothetical protein